jgi:tetratricopeptide (TPR) repeat protein
VRPIVETLLARLAEVRGAPAAFVDHAGDLLLAAVIDGGPETLSDDLDASAVPEFSIFRAIAKVCASSPPAASPVPAPVPSPPAAPATEPERSSAAAAEAAGDWDRAAQLYEALARRLTNATERAATYARAGSIYAEKLGRRTTAIEQFMVAFMATPYDPAIFRPLGALQREAGRFRELAGTYGIAADALNERGDTAGAADLLYARIDVERNLMRDARRAEQSRARAAFRFPSDPRFTSSGGSALHESGDRVAIENTQPGAASETLHTPSAISMPRR